MSSNFGDLELEVHAEAAAAVVASVRNQMGRVVLFIGAKSARGCRPQLPGSDSAIRTGQLPGGERLADERTHVLLVRRFGGEKHP